MPKPDEDYEVPKIYTGDLRSFETFNTAIEWNKAYFQKVRMGFYRRLRDVQFKWVQPKPRSQHFDDEFGGGIISSPELSMYFRVQDKADVLAFRCLSLEPI